MSPPKPTKKRQRTLSESSDDDGPSQPTQPSAQQQVQDPAQSTSSAAAAPEVVQVDEDEEEVTVWNYYDKDPEFKKDKSKPKQAADAICRRCKTKVPRTQSSTKGMNQHLENHHPKAWKTVMEAKLKAAKAKVWLSHQ
jgi:hypothetical protein